MTESLNQRHRREIAETEERWARERAAEERAERRQRLPLITVADVAAMIAAALEEERATVITELADHLAEKFEQQRDRCYELLSQIRTLTAAFESLNASFARLEGASARIIDGPKPLRRAN
ncbi:tRNA U34 5-carboxymethylaminomethyl modifying GTPase MnmE/TrmE [Bradyrhizobium sp. USDA 4449]